MSDRWSAKRQQEELVAFNTTLNAAGDNGWELVSYESVPLTGSYSKDVKGYANLLFFKREKPVSS